MTTAGTRIGTIGNYYGGLQVREIDGKYYWGIENVDMTRWEEISEHLYRALLDHNDRIDAEGVSYICI